MNNSAIDFATIKKKYKAKTKWYANFAKCSMYFSFTMTVGHCKPPARIITTQRHQKREERRICVGIVVDYHCTSVPVQAPIKQELRYIEKWKKLARLNRYTGGMYLQRVLLDTD